jgi:hypothetical protein
VVVTLHFLTSDGRCGAETGFRLDLGTPIDDARKEHYVPSGNKHSFCWEIFGKGLKWHAIDLKSDAENAKGHGKWEGNPLSWLPAEVAQTCYPLSGNMCAASRQANRIKVRSAGCERSARLATCWHGLGRRSSASTPIKRTNPTCSG